MNENNYVRVIRVTEGLKIFMPNQEHCLEIEKKLNEIGVQTRVGYNIEADWWSIYIISVPDNLVNEWRIL